MILIFHYSYWYNNTCLFPDMATAFIAIDKTDVENGCLKVHILYKCGINDDKLQVLKGSHKAGRIAHVPIGGQVGTDLERVEKV